MDIQQLEEILNCIRLENEKYSMEIAIACKFGVSEWESFMPASYHKLKKLIAQLKGEQQ